MIRAISSLRFLKKRNLFDQKKQIFLGEKAFLFKTEMEISTIQDGEHNLNGAPAVASSEKKHWRRK